MSARARGRIAVAGLLTCAVTSGLALGVFLAVLVFGGPQGDAEATSNGSGNGVPYADSPEAFSEFEPMRRAGRLIPRDEKAFLGDRVWESFPPITNDFPAAARPLSDTTPAPTESANMAPPPAAVPAELEPDSQVAALPPGRALPLDRLPAWKRYASPVVLQPGVPLIGVVIDDLGLDRKRTERSLKLPAPVILAFLPYAHNLTDQTARARAGGHEILVHVPMEPEGEYVDPGPNVLRTGQGSAEIRTRLDWALSRFSGFVGINNHMGSKFTSDRAAMDVVAGELKARGLLFLDSRTAGTTVGYKRARAAGVPTATRRVFLDRDPARAAIDAELSRLEALARKEGKAIAIGHPHDATLDALDAWLPTLRAKGLQLAPVSALVEESTGTLLAKPSPPLLTPQREARPAPATAPEASPGPSPVLTPFP
ncbi:MAG: divergent polysaccharide deacetylase family protein [Alphaproteobacteria bacterium]